MNKSIWLMTIKQLWNRPVRLVLLAGFVAFPLLIDIMSRQMGYEKHTTGGNGVVTANTTMYVLIIGAGIIGQDISDGILPLIFSRPIKRWHYILTKWLTVASLAAFTAFVSLVIHCLYIYGFTPECFHHILLADVCQICLLSMGTTSVMLLLSSLLPGAADIGVILFICVACFIMSLLENALHVPGMEDAAGNIFAVIFPSFDLVDISSPRALLSIDVGRYFAILFVCLSGSIFLVNEKEFSYGSN